MSDDLTRVFFTLPQIRAIYRAGIRRGEQSATAYEWGSTVSGADDDDLAEALHDIANEGLGFDNPGYVAFGGVEIIFAQIGKRK